MRKRTGQDHQQAGERRADRGDEQSIGLGMGVVVVFFVIKSAFLSYGKPGPLLGISPDLAKFLRDHFAATVGLPFAAIVSLILILILRETTGKLEFEALGFEFRGASAPVLLWVLCYLAITLSIKLLW